jgi:hypothetical protein
MAYWPAEAAAGYSLILRQWICSSRDGISPSGVRIWMSIASSVAARRAESVPAMPR